jgi:transcriptional regulator with XRE-family HTH domain
MSPVNVRVNGDVVRQRVNAQHMSDRQLSQALSLGTTGARTLMLADSLHPSTSLATIERLTKALGVSYGELLDPPAAPEQHGHQLPANDRVRALIQVLPGRQSGVPLDHLAIAFGLTYEELKEDLAEVTRILDGIGYTVWTTCTGVVARRSASPDADELDARLNQFRDARDGLTINHAQFLYKSLTGGLSTRGLTNDERVCLGYLVARDAIAPPASNRRAHPTDDTLYCLFPPAE